MSIKHFFKNLPCAVQCNALNSTFYNVSVERKEDRDKSQTQTLGSGLVNPRAVDSLTDLTLYSPQCAPASSALLFLLHTQLLPIVEPWIERILSLNSLQAM